MARSDLHRRRAAYMAVQRYGPRKTAVLESLDRWWAFRMMVSSRRFQPYGRPV